VLLLTRLTSKNQVFGFFVMIVALLALAAPPLDVRVESGRFVDSAGRTPPGTSAA
jgi:hypothetical protein